MGGLDVTAGNADVEECDGDSLFGDEDGKGNDNHQTAEEDEMYEAMPEEDPEDVDVAEHIVKNIHVK